MVNLLFQTHDYDPDVFRWYTGSVARFMDTAAFSSIDQVHMQTDVFMSQRSKGVDWLFCIVEPDHDNVFLGQLAIMDLRSSTPELGIWIAEPYQGRGYATQAMKLLLSLRPPNGDTVLCYPVKKANSSSIALISKFTDWREDEGECLVYRLPWVLH